MKKLSSPALKAIIPLLSLTLLATFTSEAISKPARKSTVAKLPPAISSGNTSEVPGALTVSSISFSGLQSITEKEIIQNLPVKIADKITIPGPELPETIQYLWNLRHFSDIQVEKVTLADGTIALKFIVRELPLLETIEFEGNHSYDSKELQKAAALKTGRQVSGQDMLSAARKIEKLYEGKGYLAAGAEYRLQELDGNKVKALFTISEGSRVVIEKIRFHGNSSFDDGKLRSVFQETNQNSWWRKIFGQPRLDHDKYADDKNLLVEFYRENGFRDARVIRDSVSYSADKTGLYLDIFVQEGRKYFIRNITWKGNTREFATTDILEKTFGITKGDTYNPKKINERLNYSTEHSDVSSLYLDRGYLGFKAHLEETVVQPESVDLAITLAEGEPFQLNAINIKGNTKTKDHVIRRELYTIPGETFSRKNVVRSIRELSMLNYFDPEQLTPDIQPNPDNNTVDLTYNVTEKQTDTFNASIGYSGGNGMIGSLGVTFNNFSLKDIFNGEAYKPLPHGDGQKLSFQWQFGSDQYRTLLMSFTEPWAFGSPTTVGFSAFNTHYYYLLGANDITTQKTIDQYGATVSIGRRLTWPDDYFTVNWRLKYLHNTGGFVSFLNEANAPATAEEYSITQTLSRNSIDNPIYPRNGSKNSLTAQFAGGLLPGTINFSKFTGISSWFIPVKNNLVLNLSTQQGYLSTFSAGDYIPYTDYFYMGGSGMSSLPTIPLRGYEDRSLGELFDGETSLFGGRFYSKYTAELRYPLMFSPSTSIYALAFAEAGNLWKGPEYARLADLKKSAGIGLRLYLPIIGVIGMDYGYGFDSAPATPDKTAQGWNFMFTFGQMAE